MGWPVFKTLNRKKERKKAFFPQEMKSIRIFKNLKKFSPSGSSEIPSLTHFLKGDKLTFDFYAIIILCRLGKRNFIDFSFLFNCIQEKLRNKCFQDRQTMLSWLCISRERFKVSGRKKISDVNGLIYDKGRSVWAHS